MERPILLSIRSPSRAIISSSSRIASSATRSFCSPRPPRKPASNPISQPSQRHRPTPYRCTHTSPARAYVSAPPKSRDRGPKSSEDTQTDFDALDVLRNTVAPATSIDACTYDGFALNNMARISGSGVLLIGGEAFRWRPWLREDGKKGTATEGGERDDSMKGRLKNAKGQLDIKDEAWGILELIFPKPDLLIIGTGPGITPLSPAVRQYLIDLGIRIDVQDTRNAASQFNLLATERGVSQVAAALIPIGWREER
ncbi:hypothetical protein K504DRAFT_477596 [Pleomassaria siparia CBS 279.74]|uniref:NADH dehydrogenase [ubiquinone] 1 alpha subcomplex assembly factor 3 n=1 Tax=Pleomassaria siparia CBS 279.74 TaxID=1314801 RepID=A0A6G1K6J8_9PLEO|nr:hypothetical protein K504DRAFT_477596 [Pleomassaria siparia CBS 279.74]